MYFIKHFNHLSKSDTAIAGGKGASLGEMTSAGLAVPPGFVVLSVAFEKFLESTDLNIEIDSILHSVNPKEMHTVENASAKIKDLILKAKMPKDISEEIKKEFKNLNSQFVAVRSSATAEDSSSAAWAGQLDSFLNTTGKTLLANVQRCWASLFTPRAIFYRFEKGLHNSKISVAVVIQKMIESESSGIAFSVHPVTQDYNQLIIEAGYGLGEAIVSGQITPDSYVVEKEPRRIIDKNLSVQERGIYRKPQDGGNEWQNIPQEKGAQQKLTDEQILELSELIIKIENHYGFPVDIEWAYEKNEFYITQSRPITTLKVGNNKGKSKNFVFEKEATRDLSLLAIEGLEPAMTNLYKKLKGIDPLSPFIIFYTKELIVEEWLNSDLTKKLIDCIYLENLKNSKFLESAIAKYKKHLVSFKDSKIVSLEELKKYLHSLYCALDGFIVFYFTAGDNRTPKPLLELSKKIRNADNLGDDTDKKVRLALKNIFPHTKGYETVISSDDLSEMPTVNVLRERAKQFLFIPEKFSGNISLNDFSDKNPEYNFHIETPPSNSNVLIGQVGNKGYAKGRVKILKKKEQILEIQEGDIIVSTMTTPDFLPAMQKASGIITDEGGVTCHSAIVTRELKKPCVIGTKFATQILHDGDLVEVDADNGVVRIIERAEEKSEDVQSKPITTLSRTTTKLILADKFIGALKNQELFPPIHNSTLFVDGGDWNAEKYYRKYYLDRTPFPFLITVKENEGVEFVPMTKLKKTSEEIFKLYWRDKSILIKRLREYRSQTKIIDNIYKKANHRFVEKEKFKNLVPYAETIKNMAQEMNALATFSFYFDKEMCLSFLGEVGSKISQQRLDDLWIKGTTSTSDSFEKRREKYLLNLLESGKNWGEIAEDCQFFTANYNKIANIKEVEKELKEKFILFEKKIERQKLFKAEKLEKDKIVSKHNKWLETLSSEEKKLVQYLQTIIELRDNRKDYLAKLLVVFFRIAQKLFREVKLDEKLISFYMFDDIIKGRDYLLENKSMLEKRLDGCSVFVSYGGNVEIEYGTFEETKNKLEEFFLSQQNKDKDTKVINGQSGSLGKVKGTVRIIMNIAKESGKFNKNDILVTGMTRPEYVPLMKKASAIITDEGGITCHAVIISRELKKPCIIGTKIATRVLHDGDLVEVDADNGVVRIIERAEEKSEYVQSKPITTLKKNTKILKDDNLKVKNSTDFNLKEYVFVATREVSFLECSLFIASYQRQYKKNSHLEEFGRKLSNKTLLVAKGLIVDMYRIKETITSSGDILIDLIDKNPNLLQELADLTIQTGKDVSKKADILFQDISNSFSRHDLSVIYSKWRDLFLDFFPLQALPLAVERSLKFSKNDILEKYKETLVSWRKGAQEVEVVVEKLLHLFLESSKEHFGIDFRYYSDKEVLQYFEKQNKLSLKDIADRESLYVMRWFYDDEKSFDLYLGKQAKDILTLVSDKDLSITTIGSVLSGQGIGGGKYKAQVYLINEKKDFANVPKGSVVVAKVVELEDIRVLKNKNPGAIITEEGGITSHIAISGRELQIPIVTQIKQATKLFKTGDILSLDAEKGEVNIITS